MAVYGIQDTIGGPPVMNNLHFKGIRMMSKHFMMNTHDFERSAEVLTAVSHPMRLLIMHQLVQKGLLNVSQLQYLSKIPQSTVSQHLSKLKALKVVAYDRKGLEVHYKVTDEQMIRAVKTLPL